MNEIDKAIQGLEGLLGSFPKSKEEIKSWVQEKIKRDSIHNLSIEYSYEEVDKCYLELSNYVNSKREEIYRQIIFLNELKKYFVMNK